MPEATTRRLLLALTHVMAALFCVPQTAPGKALQPHEIASSELWEPQPERVRAELVRIPGSHLVDFAITTPDASGRTNWLSRDPLGESGGLNLYGFVGNDPINNYDYLGLADVYFDTKTGVVSWAVEIPRPGPRRDTDVFTFPIGVYEGDKILLSEVLGGYVFDRGKFEEWVDGRGYHGFEGMTDADKAFAIQMVAKAMREATGIRYTRQGFGESVVGNLSTVIELSALHEDDAAEGLDRLNSSLEAAGVAASLLEVAASFVPSVSLAEAISGESGAGIHELGLLERVLAGAGHAGKLGRITNHAADIGKNLGKAPKGGLSQIDEFVDLTQHRSAHILNRHRAGAGKAGKTEFPADWSDERILHQVSDIATDPNAVRGVGKYHSPYATATRDGVEIRVDFYPDNHPRFGGQISTAYPTNVPANP